MNKVILVGRLTGDPDIRRNQNGDISVASYSLAVDRRYSRDDEKSADFISCKSFGKNAEIAEKYLSKGMKIGVVGRIQTGSYENNEGKRVYTTDVIADEQEFMESKKNPDDNTNKQSVNAKKTSESNGSAESSGFYFASNENADNGDLPF